jgi:NCS1 family nucleobase:cation symporter-1
MIVDYWLMRRGNFHVPSLYSKDTNSPYTYYKGWNLRAVVAWLCGVGFTIHGIAGSLNPTSVNQASKNMYKLGFLLSLLMGAAVYYVLCLIWPIPVYPADASGTSSEFEFMAQSEGFFAGESPDTIRGILTGAEQEIGYVPETDRKGFGTSIDEKHSV